MRIECVSRYRRGEVSHEPGQILDLRDEDGEFLMRDSPGSFRVVVADASAESATASGIAAHDRRQRGGNIR